MLFYIIIGLVALIIASYTDLRTREVPDWLNYGLVFFALGSRVIYSIINSTYQPLLEGFAGFAFFFIIGAVMFYTGQWGGGDAKHLMALGALIGLKFTVHNFLSNFLINLLLAGAVYGMIFTFAIAIKNYKVFMKDYHKRKEKMCKIGSSVTAAVIAILILSFFMEGNRTWFIALALFMFALYHLWLFVKSIEASCMTKWYPISKLTEGDWIIKDVKVNGKTIVKKTDLGVEAKQIALLRKYKVNKVLVKEGIPFVPAFLIGFIVTLIIGNFWTILFGGA